MPKKSSPVKYIVVLGGIVFFAVLIYLSMRQMQQEYEVCMSFKGGQHCATASGSSQNEAVQSAREIDCQMLATGRDETMVCLAAPPSSIRQIQK